MIIRDRKLDSLDLAFKFQVFQLLARFTEAGILIMIVETRRSQEAHDEDLRTGHSWIKHSMHQDGRAIDVCPYETYLLHGDDKLQWDAGDPIWVRLGVIGESLNLGWGGRWTKKDLAHFEQKVAK